MNFLAHILLSGTDQTVMMGNYVGDFIKGRLTPEKTANMNSHYVAGLKLHRFIDSYTDSHPIVRRARAVAAETYGKMSGIVMDIYFDHFLAKDFEKYHVEPLYEFVHRIYSVIEKNEYLLPETMIPMVRSMIRQDWLVTYATMDGIRITFERLSRRAPFLDPIKTADRDLHAHYDIYHQFFTQFFPELRNQCEAFLQDNLEQ